MVTVFMRKLSFTVLDMIPSIFYILFARARGIQEVKLFQKLVYALSNIYLIYFKYIFDFSTFTLDFFTLDSCPALWLFDEACGFGKLRPTQ